MLVDFQRRLHLLWLLSYQDQVVLILRFYIHQLECVYECAVFLHPTNFGGIGHYLYFPLNLFKFVIICSHNE
ncbi:Hypothetical protein CFV354_1519 [Campylobacter fetus subsp. venerealis NCTC 10354]|nr:Hypothetical protein CFV354_1519 [Campylobacter fetus subsp. venerealis NCTC 10354]